MGHICDSELLATDRLGIPRIYVQNWPFAGSGAVWRLSTPVHVVVRVDVYRRGNYTLLRKYTSCCRPLTAQSSTSVPCARTMPTEPKLSDLSDTEQSAVGGAAAFIEGMLLQPTIYAKNARQQGLPLTLDPRVLYRGIGAALCNEMGQLGMQFGVTGALMRIISPDSHGTPSPAAELGAAAAAGAVVAVLASPLELVMIQQQRFGGSMLSTGSGIIARHGFFGNGLYRGLGLAMARDAIYVGGMLGATPLVHRRLMQWKGVDEGDGANEPSARSATDAALVSLAASMLGGVIGAVLSHPLDVAKTCMQGDLPAATYGGSFASLRTLVREGGASRL